MAFSERYFNPELASGGNDGSSEADAWQSWADVIAGVAAGDRVNIKTPSGRFDLAGLGDLDFSASGSYSAPIWLRGYESIIGDGGLAAFELSDALQDFSWSGAHLILEGLDVLGSGNLARPMTGPTGPVMAYRSRFVAGAWNWQPGGTAFVNCYLKGGGTSAFTAGAGLYLGNILVGVNLRCDVFDASCAIINNVFRDCGAHAMTVHRMNDARSRSIVSGNRFHNIAGSAIYLGMLGAAPTDMLLVAHNIFDSCGGYAVEHDTAGTNNSNHNSVQMLANKYRALTSGFTTLTSEGPFSDNDLLTADPFEDAANGDLDLNDDAGGGAAVRAEGYMHVNTPIDLTTLVRRALASGSAGGGLLTHPGMAGGMRG